MFELEKRISQELSDILAWICTGNEITTQSEYEKGFITGLRTAVHIALLIEEYNYVAEARRVKD